jgi:hypothetical protein
LWENLSAHGCDHRRSTTTAQEKPKKGHTRAGLQNGSFFVLARRGAYE